LRSLEWQLSGQSTKFRISRLSDNDTPLSVTFCHYQ
jgi:hypothetical protein